MSTVEDLAVELNALREKFEDYQTSIEYNVDAFFLIIIAIIIYFMQAGFAFLECGCVRSKNATNILLKNILDSFLGCFAYWIIGWPLAFGAGNKFCGWTQWMSHGMEDHQFGLFFFHFVFAATAATIVSGSVAERCEFYAYIAYSVFITGFVYPIVTHWAWSPEGWLAIGINVDVDGVDVPISYRDFAGSGVVHLLGGTAAFFGAWFLGPRIGRFEEGIKIALDIKGHSVPLTAFGGFILVFGFFAFNAGSQASISQPGDGEAIAVACVSTVMAASGGALSSMIANNVIIYITHDASKWSLLTTLNGALCAMVSVCAGCNVYHPWAAVIIGLLAGLLYLAASWTVVKLRIDDPLDAVAVHGSGGLLGVLMVPIFAKSNGLVFGGGKEAWASLGWNAVGAITIMAWSAALSVFVFGILKFLGVLRVNPTIEINGLDIPKHGEPAYPLESYGDGWTECADDDKPSQDDLIALKKQGFANTAALFRMADTKTRNEFFPELFAEIKGSANDAEVRAKLKKAFDEVDEDGNGELDFNELKSMLDKAGFKASKNMLTKIMTAVDVDNSGTIDFDEFIVFFMELGPKIQIAMKLQSQFEEIDKDSSGYISKRELKQALKKEGNLTKREIAEFIATADKDGDGQISLEEWLDAMVDDMEDRTAAKALMIEKNQDHIVVNLPQTKPVANNYSSSTPSPVIVDVPPPVYAAENLPPEKLESLDLPLESRAVSIHL